MEPHTGEILAMANEPTSTHHYRIFRRPSFATSVQDRMSPYPRSSRHGVPRSKNGYARRSANHVSVVLIRIVLAGRDTHDYGVLSFTDVIVKSSNVGAIKIGMKLGPDRLSDYVQRFGFGRPVSADFPSENPGIVWDRTKWTDSALASVSMGYQVAVTPLQMVASARLRTGIVWPRVVRRRTVTIAGTG